MIIFFLSGNFFCQLLEFLCLYLHGCGIYSINLKKNLKRALTCFPLLLLSTASTLLPYHALFTVFIIFACSLFAFMYIFQDCPLNKLFIYLIIYIMIVFIQLLSIPLIQLCRIPQDSILMPLFGNSFCLLILRHPLPAWTSGTDLQIYRKCRGYRQNFSRQQLYSDLLYRKLCQAVYG